MNKSTSREMIQTAYVVKDLQASMQEWMELLHAGPFYLLKGGFEVDKLYRGNTIVVGRRSPHSLYDEKVATFEADTVYNQRDAEGFIKLNALRLRLRVRTA